LWRRDATAAALIGALAGEAPGLVLDFVWGPPAEAAFAALGRRGLGEDDADISYVQIGAVAGPDAAVPSALLRSRHIRISGSGAGSASIAVIRAEIPVYLGLIADGRIDVPVRTFPLPAIGDAWLAAPAAAVAPSSCPAPVRRVCSRSASPSLVRCTRSFQNATLVT
jgi:hypothetical protein